MYDNCRHDYYPLSQADELSFEEGDTLYITEKVCVWDVYGVYGVRVFELLVLDARKYLKIVHV